MRGPTYIFWANLIPFSFRVVILALVFYLAYRLGLCAPFQVGLAGCISSDDGVHQIFARCKNFCTRRLLCHRYPGQKRRRAHHVPVFGGPADGSDICPFPAHVLRRDAQKMTGAVTFGGKRQPREDKVRVYDKCTVSHGQDGVTQQSGVPHTDRCYTASRDAQSGI